ncbi:MAG: hypothetical protein JSS03_07055 [Proteobacteria bacterium]|nr:hypothetical protein [Pseudomonadota bacterium]
MDLLFGRRRNGHRACTPLSSFIAVGGALRVKLRGSHGTGRTVPGRAENCRASARQRGRGN